MQFEERHAFDASVETVMRMYTDRRFFDRKYQAVKALEAELLAHVAEPDLFSVRYRLVMTSDAPVPDVVRKFIGETVRLEQLDRWVPSTRRGRLEIDIKGVPVKVGADMQLVEEDGRAVNVQRWSVTCGIPLVGSKIEAVLSEDIRVKSRRDLEASRQLIREYQDGA